MSDARLTRRLILPSLAAGAAAAAIGANEAQAADTQRRYMATAGPAALSPGQVLILEGALPAVQLTRSDSMQFRLQLQTVQGQVLGVVYPKIAVGGPGFSVRLYCMGDGSVRFADRQLDFAIKPGSSVGIIAVLIGLLLPAVQEPSASMQCLELLPEGGERGVSYILPFIEASFMAS